MGLLDFLFPTRCIGCRTFGSYLCSTCFSKISFTDTDICAVCNRAAMYGAVHPVCKKTYTLDGMSASLTYNDVVKQLVYKFKYPPYLLDLHQTLSKLFYEGIIQKEGVMKLLQKDVILVPIPLHTGRMRTRGYNQTEVLAKGIGVSLHVPIHNLLVRTRPTQSQISLTREQRMRNLHGAFQLKKGVTNNNLRGKTVILVDDVVTTGATFLEAAKVLKKAGATTVWGIALAHGQ